MAFKMNRGSAFPKNSAKKSSGLPYKTKSPGLYKPSMAKRVDIYEGDIVDESMKLDKKDLADKVKTARYLDSEARIKSAEDGLAMEDQLVLTEENIGDVGQGFGDTNIDGPYNVGDITIKNPSGGRSVVSDEQINKIKDLTETPKTISLTDGEEGADATTYLRNLRTNPKMNADKIKDAENQLKNTGKITIDNSTYHDFIDPTSIPNQAKKSDMLGISQKDMITGTDEISGKYKSDISDILRGTNVRSGAPKKGSMLNKGIGSYDKKTPGNRGFKMPGNPLKFMGTAANQMGTGMVDPNAMMNTATPLMKKNDPPAEGEEQNEKSKIDFTEEREMVKREKEKINRIEGGKGKANKKKNNKKKLTIKAKNVFPGDKKGILD